MPGIDGFELRKLIREVDKERPIIFLTAMVDDGNMTMLNQIAWDSNTYYLNKVIDKTVLVQKIMDVVNIHRTRQMDKMYSHKLESEMKLAGDLQKLLLPRWCTLDKNVLVSFLYAPAMQVSGDLFEMIRLADGRYLFFIGDIAGHGISAALYMATVQAYLKLTENERDLSVHGLMNRLNKFFCNELGATTYMTALAAIVDFRTNHIIVHSAGHPAMLFCSPSRKTITSADEKKGSLPLGWFVDSEYRQSDDFEYDFDDDTIFMATTDGLFDLADHDGTTVTPGEINDLILALMQDTDVSVFPFRLKNTLERMGFKTSPDDFTFVAFQKRGLKPNFVEHVIPAKLPNVDKVAVEFSAQTDDVAQASQIELCVHEFLNNVIVHGSHEFQQKSELIYISIEKLPDGKFELRGVDHGQIWDPTGLATTEKYLTNEFNPYATSGRGIQILQAITDSVVYNSYCGLNETCFVLKNNEKETTHEK